MKTNASERTIVHINSGTCSSQVSVTLRDGLIAGVEFEGGCDGNLKGIARLVVGMEPAFAYERLNGVRCGDKPTSCPDQLAQALKEAIKRP